MVLASNLSSARENLEECMAENGKNALEKCGAGKAPHTRTLYLWAWRLWRYPNVNIANQITPSRRKFESLQVMSAVQQRSLHNQHV